MTFSIHDISQSALAGAVAILGLVILLELRSIARLRRAMDDHLQRVFEQFDLLRSQNQLVFELHARAAEPSGPVVAAKASPAIAAAAHQPPLAGGEARLQAAMAAARARQARPSGASAH